MSACAGTTKAGNACKAPPIKGTEHCHAHTLSLGSARFGSHAQATEAGKLGGRPKQPRVVDVIRERLEAEADEWFEILRDARDAMEAVTVGFGKDAYLEMVPDHKTRLRALDAVLDRSYGRPKQQTELTGADSGPIEMVSIVPLDAEQRSARAAELLKRHGHA